MAPADSKLHGKTVMQKCIQAHTHDINEMNESLRLASNGANIDPVFHTLSKILTLQVKAAQENQENNSKNLVRRLGRSNEI